MKFIKVNGERYKDFSGEKKNHLTAIQFVERCGDKTLWLFKCDCGNEIVRNHRDVFSEHIKDCGCMRSQRNAQRATKHGCLNKKSNKTRLYNIWIGVKRRSTYHEKKTHHTEGYYDRGITICNEWLSFENFKNWALSNGYTDSLTIDRIDVNGNYCPENCRWVSFKVQANNRRSNKLVEYNGETHTVSEWADKIGMKRKILENRLRKYTIEKAFNMPVRPHNVLITYNGETHNIKEWAEIKGLSYTALNQRISVKHWPIDRALNTPITTSKKMLRDKKN